MGKLLNVEKQAVMRAVSQYGGKDVRRQSAETRAVFRGIRNGFYLGVLLWGIIILIAVWL